MKISETEIRASRPRWLPPTRLSQTVMNRLASASPWPVVTLWALVAISVGFLAAAAHSNHFDAVISLVANNRDIVVAAPGDYLRTLADATPWLNLLTVAGGLVLVGYYSRWRRHAR